MYNVRLVNRDELRQLLKLYSYFKDNPELEDSKMLSELWDSIYDDPSLHYVVVDYDGELVATCNITIIKNLTRNMRPYGLIENVVTNPEHRCKGLGKMVLSKAIEIAKEHDCYKVMLLTGSKEPSTHAFYKSAGFRDDIKTGYAIKFN